MAQRHSLLDSGRRWGLGASPENGWDFLGLDSKGYLPEVWNFLMAAFTRNQGMRERISAETAGTAGTADPAVPPAEPAVPTDTTVPAVPANTPKDKTIENLTVHQFGGKHP